MRVSISLLRCTMNRSVTSVELKKEKFPSVERAVNCLGHKQIQMRFLIALSESSGGFFPAK